MDGDEAQVKSNLQVNQI